MGTVVRFPARRHARASSTTSRAASAVSRSADSPARPAGPVASTEAHHSAGMLSLCHHLETTAALAPGTSDAIASREGQSSMIDRNEFMLSLIRQSVLKSKDNLSADVDIALGHNVLMIDPTSPSLFKKQFTARIARARHDAGYTQLTMAIALGLEKEGATSPGKYQKYETRSLMPPHLYEKFCVLCDITIAWLIAGPAVARPVEKRGRKPKPAPPIRKRA